MRFLFFSSLIFSFTTIYSQINDDISNFSIKGKIIGKDTGAVVLWTFDKYNKGQSDTAKLDNGNFYFKGSVNRVCEAMLWTDLKNRNFDDPSVVRFLLVSGNVTLIYKVEDPFNPIIKGSGPQLEKQAFDKKYASLLASRYQNSQSMKALSNKNLPVEEKLALSTALNNTNDSLYARKKFLDLEFVKMHPASYLSPYLLSRHQRRMSLDTVIKYYTSLTPKIKKSRVGHDVLMYIYPLTDDDLFRKENPLIDLESSQHLSKFKSVYDFPLKDTSGNAIDLKSFQGKYLVFDFWASWCKPCIAEIPFLLDRIKNYQSDSVQFISISLDKDVNDWKGAIRKHNFTGIQLSDLEGFYSLPAIYSKVLWVPKVVIADQAGYIIEFDAPAPSEQAFELLLNKLLKLNNSIKKGE